MILDSAGVTEEAEITDKPLTVTTVGEAVKSRNSLAGQPYCGCESLERFLVAEEKNVWLLIRKAVSRVVAVVGGQWEMKIYDRSGWESKCEMLAGLS